MEYHVIIAWQKAAISTEDIIDRLPGNIRVEKMFLYRWDEALAANNYAAFYGERLEDIQYKVDHCGAGEFRVLLVEDLCPRYEQRDTTSGTREVNANLFDLKAELREATGGGHLIHASDTNREADLNCMALFGMLAHEAAAHDFGAAEDGFHIIQRNILGSQGWDSWEQLLHAVDKVTDYAVLRNVETVTSDAHELHGDTDLIVRDFQTAVTVAAAQKAALGKDRVLYTVVVGGQKQLVDFRFLGDGYYCDAWETHLLEARKRYGETSIYTLDDEDLSYSVLYHALVQKPYLSPDYEAMLRSAFGTSERKPLRKILDDYLRRNGYVYAKPKDGSVYIHPDFFRDIPVPASQAVINRLKHFKYLRGGYERDSGGSQALYTFLSGGYYLAVAKLRKIKGRIGKMLH